MKKRYTSYLEIDKELEILSLERKLHSQKLVGILDDAKDKLDFYSLSKNYLSNVVSKTKTVNTVIKFLLPLILSVLKRRKPK